MERDPLNPDEGSRDLGEAGEQLLGDLDQLRDAVARRTEALRGEVAQLIEQHPYAAIGAAFGVGYLLSGALVSRSTFRLLGFGTRFFLGALFKQAVAGGALGALANSVRSTSPPHPHH